jgi:hypothetical protein
MENKMDKQEYMKLYRSRNRKKLNVRSSIYRKHHIEEIKQYKKKYRKEHKKEINEYQLKYYYGHYEKFKTIRRKFSKEELLEHRKEYNRTHKEQIKLYNKKYREEHKEKIKEYSNNYHKTHKNQIKKQRKNYIREYQRNRRHKNAGFKLICNLRSRLWYSLKGLCKSNYTLKLLGCSVEFLKQYLSKKFHSRKNGLKMAFENYGLWHIDHIRPCASFDLTKPEEQAKCFHYTNLQPLWAEENLSKNKKILIGE